MEETFNELRWNPLLGTWVIVSSGRKKRPWRSGGCPFCPGAPEMGYGWTIKTLDNRYPALRPDARTSRGSKDLYRVSPGYGYCKVIVETPMHEGDLCDMSLDTVAAYLEELRRVTAELCGDDRIRYVLPFRNKGEAIGVSLTHPHSQVYALSFIPPRVRREITNMEAVWKGYRDCLLCRINKLEREEGTRVIYENDRCLAFLPFYAMWPYEVHVYPKNHVGGLEDLGRSDLEMLADALIVVTAAYNKLFDMDLPYMMVFHQKPCRGSYDFYHLHVEFYPIHRDRDKVKYAAGIEWGAWVFTYDALPEEKALELRHAARGALEALAEGGRRPRGEVPGRDDR